MQYKVLYRKYRPTNFDEIIGQKNIVSNLKKSVENENFSHAYIFTGPRGTGKTSTAKVLAKSINCSNSKNGNACGTCPNCQDFGNSPDIIEIDAASNNGVDEIRELRSNITHAPTESKYKIYIIDEVHMLSPGAFNALLKTLEEPPQHAIFILATTEVYKVPITILSRCQRYDFKKIEKCELITYIKEICQKEKIEYEESALEEIYSLSEGCLRDALSILDQISKEKRRLTLEDILESYNIISNKSIDELLKLTITNQINKLIEKLEEFENSGMNAQKLIKKIINYVEKLAIDSKTYKSSKYNFNFLDRLIRNLNQCYIDARINDNTFTIIKLCFLELCQQEEIKTEIPKNQKATNQTENNLKPDSNLETKKEIKEENVQEQNETMSIEKIRLNNCFVDASKNTLNDLIDIWNNKVDKSKFTAINPNDYKPVVASNNYAAFAAEESSLVDLFNIKSEIIEKQLKKNKIDIKVVALSNENWKKEKEEYIKKIKSGFKYELIQEPEKKEDIAEAKGQADALFAEKIIEIS